MKVIQEGKMAMLDDQLRMGFEVEHEHMPTYERLVQYFKDHDALPSPEWLFKSITVDHLDPNNPIEPGNPEYYTVLKGAGL